VPTYQYACTACGHQLEAVQTFADEPLTECPACEGRLRKLFSSVGIVFKGSGFYRTDSRSSPSPADSAPAAKDGSGKDSSSKDSSGKDSSGKGSSGKDSASTKDSGSAKESTAPAKKATSASAPATS
jgi:putative FmdB family regulatory protein